MKGMRRIFLLGLILSLIFLFRLFSLSSQKSYSVGQEVSLITTLSSEPQIFKKSQRFRAKEGIEVIVSRYPEYHYGDKLKISGTLKTESSRLSSQNISLLKFKGDDLKLIFPQIEILEEKRGNWFLEETFFLRQKLTSNYQEFLPEPSSSLLIGIVLGVKTQMNEDFKENLRRAGLTHVVVASGLNVTLVAGFLHSIFAFFLRRQLILPFILLGIFFYTLLAGFEAPIIRAALMGSLAFSAQTFGRQNWVVLSLVLTGFLMLLVKPLLLFDLGFQLSFLATAGLIFVKPRLETLGPMVNLKEIPFFGESLTTTLSAQIATLPLILTNFGYYSIFSILANTLVLWTIPWIMGIGGVAGILGLLLKPLGQILSLVVYSLLFYFEKISLLFSKFTLFSLEASGFSLFFSLAYFSFLIALLFWLAKGRKDKVSRGERGC